MGPSAPKHGQIRTLLMTFPSWSLSRPLLMAILEDRLSDQFVAQWCGSVWVTAPPQGLMVLESRSADTRRLE